jgi:hypothetical protein
VPALLDWPLRILLITAVLIGFFFLIDFVDNTYGSPIYGITTEEWQKYDQEQQKYHQDYQSYIEEDKEWHDTYFVTLIGQPKPKEPSPPLKPQLPLEHFIGYERLTWAFMFSLYTGIASLYVVGVFFVIQLTKRHERNTVAWITACVLFSPLLAGIAYLLTWPKGRPLRG